VWFESVSRYLRISKRVVVIVLVFRVSMVDFIAYPEISYLYDEFMMV